jgi:hypothetical protein
VKILLLNQVFYPDVVATAQYLSDLAAALAEQGHEVTVVSGRRAYEHPETIFPARETWRGVKILRIFSTRFGKAPNGSARRILPASFFSVASGCCSCPGRTWSLP